MNNEFEEIIKNNIKKGPSHKSDKKIILKICEELGIDTIDKFWDVLIESQQIGCIFNLFQDTGGACFDSNGDHVAYGSNYIANVLNKSEKDLTCYDVSEKCGSCAYINQITSNLIRKLFDMLDEHQLNKKQDNND